jgi:uncharacterized membrane protein (UPF0127 family)
MDMRRWPALVLAVAVLSGCQEKAEPPFVPAVTFDTATAWIRSGDDSTSLLVEVAKTDAQRSYGLMARPSLDPNSGMVFLYDTVQADTTQGFWMFRTRMPLDIAFTDSAGTIVRILQMEPCLSDLSAASCPTYAPRVSFRSALEVNRGWFTQHGVGEGSVVRVDSASGG